MPRLEQLDQLAGDIRVPYQRVVLIALGEAAAQQLTVLPVGAQDGHLTAAQRRSRHQAVQRVALGAAIPDGAHGAGDQVADPGKVELHAPRPEHAEVMEVPAGAVVVAEPGRHLLDHRQAERLQHREQIGQRGLAACLVELQPGQRIRGVDLVLQRHHVGGLGAQPLELRDVEAGHVHRGGRLVVAGEQPGVAACQLVAGDLTKILDQGVGEGVVPGPAGGDHVALQLVDRDVGNRATDVDGEVEARRIDLAERQVVVNRLPVEPLFEQVLQPDPKVGGDAVAREGDGRRNAPALEVGPHEQPHLRVLLEAEQGDDRRTQILGGGCEQLVLGEALEDRDDGLVIVRPREQVLLLHDLLELAADERNRPRRLHVRLAGEEADHPQLAGDGAVGAHLLDPDVVHPDSAVDGCLAVGLGDHQQRAAEHPLAKARVEPRDRHRLGEPRTGLLGQDPQA